MIYFNLTVDDKTNFSCLKLDWGIQHLEVVMSPNVSSQNKKSLLYGLKKFLYNYIQKTRKLRILDLRKVEELEDVYFDIWSLYEIYYPISVKNVDIRNAQTLRFVSAMGAESISICHSPYLERIKFGKSLRNIYLPYTGIMEFSMPQKCGLKYSDAFRGCSNLRKIDLSNCKDLEYVCFSDCSNLVDITLPNNIKSLDTKAFSGCRNLKIIKGGEQVEALNKATFEDCYSLEFIDNWTFFKNVEDEKLLANLYFTKEITNQIGIVIYDIHNMWIIWNFCNKKYYLMKDRFYNTDGCDDYCSFDGGGEIIDADIKLNDIVVFDVKETPIIKKNNHICLLWESQCTNVKLKGKLFRPTDGLCMSIEEQKFLLRYFSNIDINDFFEKTRAIIDQLNIDDIINSYDISYKMYWQVRPGKDDFEWYISHTKYTYSDPYIETLLPIEERTDYSTP